MVGMDIPTRTIQLRGGPHDGERRYVPEILGDTYIAWNVGRKRCGKPVWGPTHEYRQDPDQPSIYHYQEH